MTRPRGTPHRGGRYGSIREAEHPRSVKEVNTGYDSTVSPPNRALIEEWEFSEVVEFLATGKYGNQINFYWLVKNMLVNLVEEVLMNWSTTTTSVMDVRGLLVHLDRKLASLDASLAGG